MSVTFINFWQKDLNGVPNTLNNFDRNLKFTLDKFNDVVPHFLYIEIHPDGLLIYCKPINPDQYNHHTSFLVLRHDH